MTDKGRVRRGFFGIGIEHTKIEHNVGSLWRTADLFGAAFMCTIGRRYTTQATDTMKSHRHVPLFHYATLEDLLGSLPIGCKLVGIEIDPRARTLAEFKHPERALYVLGAEDEGLSPATMQACDALVCLPGRSSLNVSVAGSIVLYDRMVRA